jgi:hypothetical protein
MCIVQIPVPLPYRHVTAVVSGTCVALEAAVSVGVVRGGRSRGSVAVEHRAGVRVRGDVLADGGGVDAGVTLSLVTAVATSTTRSGVVCVPRERPSVSLSWDP